ncbi:MAG: hypothetical protein WD768_13585 [Phycisphaeraceae bacterium]
MSSTKKVKQTARKGQVTATQVMRLLEPSVERHQPSDFRLILKRARYNSAHDRWIVYFDTDQDDVDMLEYVRCLTDIEEEVTPKAKKLGFSVFLTSVGNPEL